MDIAFVGKVENVCYRRRSETFTDPAPGQCERIIKLTCETTIHIIPLDQTEALKRKFFDIVYLDPLASEEMKHAAAQAVMATGEDHPEDGKVEML